MTRLEELEELISKQELAVNDKHIASKAVADAYAEKIKKTGIIIAENQENEEILQNYGEFTLDRQRCYGKIKISIFRHKDFVQVN